MAFPVTYFNGLIGWREPGAAWFHTFPIGDSKLELAIQINKSDWVHIHLGQGQAAVFTVAL